MPIRTERHKLHLIRIRVTISTRKPGQSLSHRHAFWHKHGTHNVKINDSQGLGVRIQGKDEIMRLREFLAHVCKLKGWKK